MQKVQERSAAKLEQKCMLPLEKGVGELCSFKEDGTKKVINGHRVLLLPRTPIHLIRRTVETTPHSFCWRWEGINFNVHRRIALNLERDSPLHAEPPYAAATLNVGFNVADVLAWPPAL